MFGYWNILHKDFIKLKANVNSLTVLLGVSALLDRKTDEELDSIYWLKITLIFSKKNIGNKYS